MSAVGHVALLVTPAVESDFVLFGQPTNASGGVQVCAQVAAVGMGLNERK